MTDTFPATFSGGVIPIIPNGNDLEINNLQGEARVRAKELLTQKLSIIIDKRSGIFGGSNDFDLINMLNGQL